MLLEFWVHILKKIVKNEKRELATNVTTTYNFFEDLIYWSCTKYINHIYNSWKLFVHKLPLRNIP